MLLVGLLTLLPSFNLSLTGDDYLGLWRYDFYVNGVGGEKVSLLDFFLSDYGPQDVLTALIHHYFQFNHQVYYIISFALRLIASLSFLWPVYKLTKNKWAALAASGFFLITVTGLEATDWSFNMPSYVAIAIMNTLLGVFVVSRTKNNIITLAASTFLFVAAIISQPIRMMFLPVLMMALESYWLLTTFNWKNLCWWTVKVCMYAILMAGIMKYSHYGEAVSARGKDALLTNYGKVIQQVEHKNYKLLLSPISQIGVIVLPNNFLYQRLEVWGVPRTFRQVVIPAFVGFVVWLVILKCSKKQLILYSAVGALWTRYVWQIFVAKTSNPVQPFELLTYLLGGYLLISAVLWWINLRNQKYLQLCLMLAILIMFGGFMVPWLRVPGTIHEITGRYLIVPGAGLAWLMVVFLSIKTDFNRKLALITVFGLLFSLHPKTRYRYLCHLSEVRGIELTNRLRGSIKQAKNFGNNKVSLVFYFEGDNPEILQHSFIFGFPVISHYQFGITGPWYNIAPTNIWEEVVSAYQDGQSLKRFMPGPWIPTKLEDIYAYRLENRQLIDVTEEKREILKNLKTKPQPPF